MWTGEIYFLAKEAGIPQFIILMTFAAHKTLSVAGALLAGLFLSSCSSQQQVEAPARLPAYHFVPGKTAVLHNGKAIPPRNAPSQVKPLRRPIPWSTSRTGWAGGTGGIMIPIMTVPAALPLC